MAVSQSNEVLQLAEYCAGTNYYVGELMSSVGLNSRSIHETLSTLIIKGDNQDFVVLTFRLLLIITYLDSKAAPFNGD